MMIPIHFFTIVLNGMPFIRHHIGVFKRLHIPWHWHIIEGVADLKYDTAWGVNDGAFIPREFHNRGSSIDGTSEYLMFLLEQNRKTVSLYKKPPGEFWDGKLEMVKAPIKNLPSECLLWQVDSDELWEEGAIERVHQLFEANPKKTSAYFYCHYFLGPKKHIVSDNVKSTGEHDWLRVWRFKRGLGWKSHEPPVLVNGGDRDYGQLKPFTRYETFGVGITFQHFAYATKESVKFKEKYYGYAGFLNHWKWLQRQRGRVLIDRNLPWISSGTLIEDWDEAKYGKLLWKM